ncbi:MAG: hypothetical protein J0H06_05365 [Actinobacteria bacterium]|nr:hypothetical protein [Actinomycetota bacterium]OJU80546.1 MAG: hypothetical protein BGO11_07415 [Solirubrobacterales bacterium 70-9]
MSLFRRGPKLHQCFFCSEAIPETEKYEHYRSHLIEVTDNNGQRAFTFECPVCGLMDEAWGGGRPVPESNAVSAMQVHLMQRHSIMDF